MNHMTNVLKDDPVHKVVTELLDLLRLKFELCSNTSLRYFVSAADRHTQNGAINPSPDNSKRKAAALSR